MARYLQIYVGYYDAVRDMKNIQVVGQTTETGHEMVAKGENVGAMMLACPDDTLHLFTNNDHFVNGVRLACKKTRIDHDAVTIFEFEAPVNGLAPALNSIEINAFGRLNYWPSSFAAIEDALSQL